MPVTSQSVPHLREALVAESKKTDKPAPRLAKAAESGDPAVQWLLAERNTWTSVGNDDKVAEMDRRLAELGYAV